MIPRTGNAFPFVYGSRDKNVFAKKVKKGSVLWVIGATSDKRPPSLVSKLHVIGRVDDPGGETIGVPEAVLRSFRDQFKYIAVGDPSESRFYGYNNASRVLLSLVLNWVRKERHSLGSCLAHKEHAPGSHLMRLRSIVPRSSSATQSP